MKKLLLTGASGFVGRNILPLLSQQYEVTTCGRNLRNMIQVDLSKEMPVLTGKYEVVLHAAGKAHTYPRTETEIKEYDDVNFHGTVNLCSALEKSGTPDTFVYVSSAAVYGCDCGEKIDEYQNLNPKTPYAISKKKAEDFLQRWCMDHHVRLAIIRPSLIAGPNPPGNLGSMIKGISSGNYLSIAGGKAQKSVLVVEDIARLVPLLERKGGIYNVCSDDQPTFRELETIICSQFGLKRPICIPYWFARCLAYIGDLMGPNALFNTKRLIKITTSLTFNNYKAKSELGWQPLSVKENFKL